MEIGGLSIKLKYVVFHSFLYVYQSVSDGAGDCSRMMSHHFTGGLYGIMN